MEPWELNWIEFRLPDGGKASYAIDGRNVAVAVDDDDIPEGRIYQDRLAECYIYFFENIYGQ